MPQKHGSRPRRPEAKAPNPPQRGPRGPLRLSQRRDATKVAKPAPEDLSSSRAFVLFGADEFCKPRAARFAGADPALLATAAETMNLCLFEVKAPDLAAIAKRLPLGQLHADGRGLVPFVKPDVYQDLVQETVGNDGPTYEKQSTSKLPRTWDEIAPGDLVLAHETLEVGWWEAVVLARDGDLLTLRFRDYPKYAKFVRHRSAVALIQSEA
jgi:hypothetical protein